MKEALKFLSKELAITAPNWCIFGSAALWLNGVKDIKPHDIDILMSSEEAERTAKFLARFQRETPPDSGRFRSLHHRFLIQGTEVDISGDLQILTDSGEWNDVRVNEILCQEGVRFASISECLRLLQLFGRENDLEKVKKIKNQFSNKKLDSKNL